MILEASTIQDKIAGKFGNEVSNFRMEKDIFTFDASSKAIHDIVKYMHEDEILSFNFLTDICGVHYPHNDKESQFAVVYLLHNWINSVRVRIKVYLNDQPEVSTVTDIFKAAGWMERETFDFFGIKFIGHPDLRRILNADSVSSHPMRKEYPLEDAGRSDKDDRFFGRTPYNYEVETKGGEA